VSVEEAGGAVGRCCRFLAACVGREQREKRREREDAAAAARETRGRARARLGRRGWRFLGLMGRFSLGFFFLFFLISLF
jgi:hypothetical protein